MDAQLQQLLAKQTIQEISSLYMRGLDRLDRDLLLAQFWDDGWCEYGFYNASPGEFIDFALGALKDHVANQHFIGNTLIDIDGNQAFGEIYFQAYHKVPAEDGFEDMIIAGRYLDRYECRNGIWKLAYRSEVVDWSRSAPTNDPYFELAPGTLRGGRQDDAVYHRDNRRKP
ncbi:nuclear transport factor 2 family protein [Halioglobus maricola]|uniref:Nuclear transport factor 2 family protein n=1 Tax=Halioglobus maricola TaxID=2601894 RepID=A0A5P9NH13_9GAMM|nr:nuclear transport factor 2 family protein [Halioglobus maricola]QFU75117.1 nuclear transport factor 2 family protein [Halioglobus maricola]